MAADNLNVWYDPSGDHLEIVFDQKVGAFEETSLDNVMCKRDVDGNLLAISIFELSSFARTRPPAEQASGYGRWTLFNLDVDDGTTFDFDVALAYERLGAEESDPEKTNLATLEFAPADASARCSVFFHGETSNRPLRTGPMERTLEIMHKPLSSPVISIGKNLSSVSVVSLCRDQLVLSLRLFQPQKFVTLLEPMTTTAAVLREWRDEVRRRAYGALGIHRAARPAPYTLRGRQAKMFEAFARRLRDFHVDRNRYRCIRWDPTGPILASIPDDVAAAKFLRRVARLMTATDLFEEAQESHIDSDEMRLIRLVMAAETLFTDDDKGELSYRLAHRIAVLNGADSDDRKQHWELVRSMYEARSKLMHGAAFVRKPSSRLKELVGYAGFIEIPPDRLLAFNNVVRASILYFIALADSPREELLDILDRSLWDPSEVAELRRRANEYWGLPGHEDEMLCSGRWVT